VKTRGAAYDLLLALALAAEKSAPGGGEAAKAEAVRPPPCNPATLREGGRSRSWPRRQPHVLQLVMAHLVMAAALPLTLTLALSLNLPLPLSLTLTRCAPSS